MKERSGPALRLALRALRQSSPLAAHKKWCRRAHIALQCYIRAQDSRAYIVRGAQPDIRAAASNSAPAHLRRCTNNGFPRGSASRLAIRAQGSGESDCIAPTCKTASSFSGVLRKRSVAVRLMAEAFPNRREEDRRCLKDQDSKRGGQQQQHLPARALRCRLPS